MKEKFEGSYNGGEKIEQQIIGHLKSLGATPEYKDFRLIPNQPIPAKWDALYVVALDEIFTEIHADKKHLADQILINLESRVKECIKHNKPIYLNFQGDIIENYLESLIKLLGNNSALVSEIKKNMEANTEYDNPLNHQMNCLIECDKKKCETLLLGGCFGCACVWNTATSMAENIYTQTLAYNSHPNVRLHEQCEWRVKNAIIDPGITEGCHSDFKNDFFLGQWILAPMTVKLEDTLGQYHDAFLEGKLNVDDDYLSNLYDTHLLEKIIPSLLKLAKNTINRLQNDTKEFNKNRFYREDANPRQTKKSRREDAVYTPFWWLWGGSDSIYQTPSIPSQTIPK